MSCKLFRLPFDQKNFIMTISLMLFLPTPVTLLAIDVIIMEMIFLALSLLPQCLVQNLCLIGLSDSLLQFSYIASLLFYMLLDCVQILVLMVMMVEVMVLARLLQWHCVCLLCWK